MNISVRLLRFLIFLLVVVVYTYKHYHLQHKRYGYISSNVCMNSKSHESNHMKASDIRGFGFVYF